jgi:hypothetical protein
MSIIAFVYLYFLSPFQPYEIKIMGFITYFLFFTSYLLTGILNPGIPKKNLWLNEFSNYKDLKDIENEVGPNYRICQKCSVVMVVPNGTYHCDECEVCIEGKLLK